MSKLEKNICNAEIAYKKGQSLLAIRYAKSALKVCNRESVTVALKIFIARAYSRLGYYDKSNTIYRGLLKENIYMPPVVMGLMYNNFKNPDKQNNNMRLMKICLHLR